MDVKAVIGRIYGPGGDGWKKICHEKSAEVIVPQKREGPNNFGQSKS